MAKRKGRHPQNALTATFVRKAKAPGRYSDGNCLYLVVDERQVKRWELRLTVQGKRRDIGLGGAGLVSLIEARETAARYRKIAREGGDPLAARRKERATVPTFAEAAQRVHAERSATFKNTKHAKQWLTTLETYVFPVIGDKRVDRVDTPDILRALSPIWLTIPETARRVRQRVKTVFDWAKAAGFRAEENPTLGVEKGLPKQPDRAGHFKALPYSDVPDFISDLRTSSNSLAVKLALEFLILTAARTGEVLGADWSEIDFRGKAWTVPAGRMKGGRAHRVPLTARAIEILTAAEKLSQGNLVFPGRRWDEPLSGMAFLMVLRRMGVDATAHGFRSSFRDWAAERTSFPREVCEHALAHAVRDKTEAAYWRSDMLEKRRNLMSAWAAFLSPSKAKVVPFREGAA